MQSLRYGWVIKRNDPNLLCLKGVNSSVILLFHAQTIGTKDIENSLILFISFFRNFRALDEACKF